MDNIRTFKLVLVGDGGVGKTTYIKKLHINEFEHKYVATLGVEVHPITLHTNYGDIRFNCWDTAGVEKFGGLRDSYYVLGDAAIVMGSLHDMESLDHMQTWRDSVKKHINSENIINVFSKTDLIEEDIEIPDAAICISAADETNLQVPLLTLAMKLMNVEDMVIVE
tara:strand:+ start:258 stop:755 length:498 start_codon:yes stop_codon:yes gene_type:complete